MKIEIIGKEQKQDKARITATLTWEDCARPVQELYFETTAEFSSDLTCDAHAFLVGCAIPATHYGEKRIFIDSAICPELEDGLVTAMSWINHWYNKDVTPPKIESVSRSTPLNNRLQKRSGFFFSGGIDSYATFLRNRQMHPVDHPGVIKDGLLVYGLEVDDKAAFQHVNNSLAEVAQDIGITLMPVYTNLYLMYRKEDEKANFHFWNNKFSGAALAAVGHAFSRRLGSVYIASDFDIPSLALRRLECVPPFGIHPLLVPSYSSNDLHIRHDGMTLSRLQKTSLVVTCNAAFQNIRVCNQFTRYRANVLNCGECEKCIRTMLELLALGVLDKTRAFNADDVSSKLVYSLLKSPRKIHPQYYLELIPKLKEIHREDLVDALKDVLVSHRKYKWKKKVREAFSRVTGIPRF